MSNQRKLEAELSHAVKQVEATRQDLASMNEKKEESDLMAQKLSLEMKKFHKDLEQKDKILSAMLRKSKLETTEKQMLLKEVKLSKARRKQAEQETQRWKVVLEGKHERRSLKSMLLNLSSRMDVFPGSRGVQHSSTGSSNIANEPDQLLAFPDHYLQQTNGDLCKINFFKLVLFLFLFVVGVWTIELPSPFVLLFCVQPFLPMLSIRKIVLELRQKGMQP